MNEKFCILIISLKFVPKGMKGPIDWFSGLVPNMWRVIIWTNADQINLRIYAALRGDELICWIPQQRRLWSSLYLVKPTKVPMGIVLSCPRKRLSHKNNVIYYTIITRFPQFFRNEIQGLFKDLSRTKLHFSRTITSSSGALQMLYSVMK